MYSPWSAWWANVTWPWILLVAVVAGFLSAIVAVVIIAMVTGERPS
jgi:hypothetical protein